MKVYPRLLLVAIFVLVSGCQRPQQQFEVGKVRQMLEKVAEHQTQKSVGLFTISLIDVDAPKIEGEAATVIFKLRVAQTDKLKQLRGEGLGQERRVAAITQQGEALFQRKADGKWYLVEIKVPRGRAAQVLDWPM